MDSTRALSRPQSYWTRELWHSVVSGKHSDQSDPVIVYIAASQHVLPMHNVVIPYTLLRPLSLSDHSPQLAIIPCIFPFFPTVISSNSIHSMLLCLYSSLPPSLSSPHSLPHCPLLTPSLTVPTSLPPSLSPPHSLPHSPLPTPSLTLPSSLSQLFLSLIAQRWTSPLMCRWPLKSSIDRSRVRCMPRGPTGKSNFSNYSARATSM